MADGDFADFIKHERERLSTERDQLHSEQRELESKLDQINQEFSAIEAYEAAKRGKATPLGKVGAVGTRTRRGSRRESLMRLIQEANGLSRGEILQNMDLKGDKAGEMSVSNALTALTKTNLVRREGGKYYAT